MTKRKVTNSPIVNLMPVQVCSPTSSLDYNQNYIYYQKDVSSSTKNKTWHWEVVIV